MRNAVVVDDDEDTLVNEKAIKNKVTANFTFSVHGRPQLLEVCHRHSVWDLWFNEAHKARIEHSIWDKRGQWWGRLKIRERVETVEVVAEMHMNWSERQRIWVYTLDVNNIPIPNHFHIRLGNDGDSECPEVVGNRSQPPASSMRSEPRPEDLTGASLASVTPGATPGDWEYMCVAPQLDVVHEPNTSNRTGRKLNLGEVCPVKERLEKGRALWLHLGDDSGWVTGVDDHSEMQMHEIVYEDIPVAECRRMVIAQEVRPLRAQETPFEAVSGTGGIEILPGTVVHVSQRVTIRIKTEPKRYFKTEKGWIPEYSHSSKTLADYTVRLTNSSERWVKIKSEKDQIWTTVAPYRDGKKLKQLDSFDLLEVHEIFQSCSITYYRMADGGWVRASDGSGSDVFDPVIREAHWWAYVGLDDQIVEILKYPGNGKHYKTGKQVPRSKPITISEKCTVGGVVFFYMESPRPGWVALLNGSTGKPLIRAQREVAPLRPTFGPPAPPSPPPTSSMLPSGPFTPAAALRPKRAVFHVTRNMGERPQAIEEKEVPMAPAIHVRRPNGAPGEVVVHVDRQLDYSVPTVSDYSRAANFPDGSDGGHGPYDSQGRYGPTYGGSEGNGHGWYDADTRGTAYPGFQGVSQIVPPPMYGDPAMGFGGYNAGGTGEHRSGPPHDSIPWGGPAVRPMPMPPSGGALSPMPPPPPGRAFSPMPHSRALSPMPPPPGRAVSPMPYGHAGSSMPPQPQGRSRSPMPGHSSNFPANSPTYVTPLEVVSVTKTETVVVPADSDFGVGRSAPGDPQAQFGWGPANSGQGSDTAWNQPGHDTSWRDQRSDPAWNESSSWNPQKQGWDPGYGGGNCFSGPSLDTGFSNGNGLQRQHMNARCAFPLH